MTSILDRAPDFKARAVRGAGELVEVSRAGFAGRWLVVLFYPRDFTAVCPTEVLELSRRASELEALGASAISVDDVDTHRRWIAERLGPVAIPTDGAAMGETTERAVDAASAPVPAR